MSDLILAWISPVDRARIPNDILTRVSHIESINQQILSSNLLAQGLDEVSADLGLVQTGEFRSGNGVEPGAGFTGVRMGYPGFSYNGITYFFAGVLNDTLQAGISSLDGTVQGGAGSAVLDVQGVRIYQGATERARLGNLNGFLDYVSALYGVAVGDSNNYMKYDSTNGLRIKGVAVVTGNFPLGLDIWDEDSMLSPDGTRVNFAVGNQFQAGTLQIIQDGLWLKGGGADYTEGSASTIYMNRAPQTGDSLRVNYVKSSDLSTIYNETPSGAINGSNTTFTTLNNHVPGSLQVFLNGITLDLGDDYLNANKTFIMTSAPQATDTLKLAYMVNVDSNLICQETPTGAINNVNVAYTTANNFTAGTAIVILNGIKQALTDDYLELSVNQISMTVPPRVGDSLWITYRKA